MKYLVLLAVVAVAPAVAVAENAVEGAVSDFRQYHAGEGAFTCTENANAYPTWVDRCTISNDLGASKYGVLSIGFDRDGDPTMFRYRCEVYDVSYQTGGWVSHPDGGQIYDKDHVHEVRTYHGKSVNAHPQDDNSMAELRQLIRSDCR